MPKNGNGKKKHKSDGKKALKLVRKVIRSQEIKFIQLDGTAFPDWSGTQISNIFLPTQGLTDQNRIGDSITTKSLRLAVTMSAVDAPTSIRLIIIVDKHNTVATLEEVLFTTGSAQIIVSDYNHDTRKEFIVLYDKVVNLEFPSYDTNVMVSLPKIIYKKKLMNMRNKKIVFNAGTTTVNVNKVRFWMVSDINPTNPTDRPQVTWNLRGNFIDT